MPENSQSTKRTRPSSSTFTQNRSLWQKRRQGVTSSLCARSMTAAAAVAEVAVAPVLSPIVAREDVVIAAATHVMIT